MNSADAIARGIRAQQLIDDPILNGIFAAVERDCIEALKRSKPGSEDERTGLIAKLNAVEDLRQELVSVVTTGKNAEQRQRAAID